MRIEVTYLINNTTKNVEFTAKESTAQMLPGSEDKTIGSVSMVEGSDEKGPILDAMFADVQVIIRRPDVT